MLGIILAPYGQIPGAYPSGIMYSWGPNGQYLCPEDGQYNTRGEAGFYTDTPLGGGNTPSDFEIAKSIGYLPFVGGWVTSQNAYYPGPWDPPNGYRPNGAYASPSVPRYLGDASDASGTVDASLSPGDQLIATLNDHNQKIFTLSLISTLAVTIGALFTTYRTARLLKEDRRRSG